MSKSGKNLEVSDLTDAQLDFRIEQLARNRTYAQLLEHLEYQKCLAEQRARQQCGVGKTGTGLEYRV